MDDNEAKLEADTSENFAETFGDKTDFNSWEEFTTLLEEFQIKSGSAFKLKSASSVDYINEKRVNDFIPERFVYAKVKMICVHFGLPTITGAGQRKSYMGKGCGAFMNVCYKKGALRITQTQLTHRNHPLGHDGDSLPLRQFRVFQFTDELDLMVAKEVMVQNPYELVNGEKKWAVTVANLKGADERMANITSRLVKRRMRLLMDTFLRVSNGEAPHVKDEMGQILFRLDQTRKQTQDSLPRIRGPKKKRVMRMSYTDDLDYEDDDVDDDDDDYSEEVSKERRGRSVEIVHNPEAARSSERVRRLGLKRKVASICRDEDDDYEDDNDHDFKLDNDLESSHGARRKVTPHVRGRRGRGRPAGKRLSASPGRAREQDPGGDAANKSHSRDLTSLVSYLQHKDQQDRKLRQQEVDLQRQQLAVLRREQDLHKQRLESERSERKVLMDFLRTQSRVLESFMSNSRTPTVKKTGVESESSQKLVEMESSQNSVEMESSQKSVEMESSQKSVEMESSQKSVELASSQKSVKSESPQKSTECAIVVDGT